MHEYAPNNVKNETVRNPPVPVRLSSRPKPLTKGELNIQRCGLIPQITTKAPAGENRSPFFKGGQGDLGLLPLDGGGLPAFGGAGGDQGWVGVKENQIIYQLLSCLIEPFVNVIWHTLCSK